MADTSLRVRTETKDRLAALAQARGLSLTAYLDELSRKEEQQVLLGRATASFEKALTRPGFVEAFDEAFGGPSALGTDRSAPRAA